MGSQYLVVVVARMNRSGACLHLKLATEAHGLSAHRACTPERIRVPEVSCSGYKDAPGVFALKMRGMKDVRTVRCGW